MRDGHLFFNELVRLKHFTNNYYKNITVAYNGRGYPEINFLPCAYLSGRVFQNKTHWMIAFYNKDRGPIYGASFSKWELGIEHCVNLVNGVYNGHYHINFISFLFKDIDLKQYSTVLNRLNDTIQIFNNLGCHIVNIRTCI